MATNKRSTISLALASILFLMMGFSAFHMAPSSASTEKDISGKLPTELSNAGGI
jgi:hypothetical protein